MISWLRRLDQAFFSFGSPVCLGVFRAIFAGLIFINLAMISIDFNAWFTEKGYVPIAAERAWNGTVDRFNLLNGVTDTRITAVFYALVMLAALLSCIGLFTRISTIALIVGMISLHLRNPIILHGGDTVMRAGAFYLAFSPAGAAFSLDQWLRVRKNPNYVSPDAPLWTQNLLKYQWALIYFTTAWGKAGGDHWRDGTATWYPVQILEFKRFWFPPFFDQQPFLMATTYGTLILEVALATLVFNKTYRKWVLLGGILLHASIEWRMNIPLFAFLMVSGYIVFYSGEEVSEWFRRLALRFPKLNWFNQMVNCGVPVKSPEGEVEVLAA